MSDIHAELHLLVLRKRWLRWSLRNYRPGDYQLGTGRHTRLAFRLTQARPTYQERYPRQLPEMLL